MFVSTSVLGTDCTDAKRRRLSVEEDPLAGVGYSASSSCSSLPSSSLPSRPFSPVPRYVCGPMVDQSDLAFRLLCLHFRTDLCYTPMLNSKQLLQTMDNGLYEELLKCDKEFLSDIKEVEGVYLKEVGGPDEDGYTGILEEQARRQSDWASVEKLIQKVKTEVLPKSQIYQEQFNAFSRCDMKTLLGRLQCIRSDPNYDRLSNRDVFLEKLKEAYSDVPWFVKHFDSLEECNGSLPPVSGALLSASHNKFLDQEFATSPVEHPNKVIGQLCGDSPSVILAAALLLQNWVRAIDLNCGCPQGIAKKGHYGSFLLHEPRLVSCILRTLRVGLDNPSCFCTLKMRKVRIAAEDPVEADGYKKTVYFVDRCVEAGISMLTIHCRIKEEKGQHAKEADWPVAKVLKQHLLKKGGPNSIPLLCNGGIESAADAEKCISETGTDGVMSAEAILEDPQIFLFREDQAPRERLPQDMTVELYLRICNQLFGEEGAKLRTVKAHVFHCLYAGLQTFPELRGAVGDARSISEIADVLYGNVQGDDGIAIPAPVEQSTADGTLDEQETAAPAKSKKQQKKERKKAQKNGEVVRVPIVSLRQRRLKHEAEQTAAVNSGADPPKPFPNIGWYRRYRQPVATGGN